MSALHQFRIEYSAEEDRLLFRISTTDAAEVRLWLTRRFVKRFWQALGKLVERDPSVAAQTDPLAKQSLVAFQRETAVAKTDFSQPYVAKGEVKQLLGEAPMLVTKLKASVRAQGRVVLTFAAEGEQQVNITLNDQYLHSLRHLIVEVVKKTDWNLDLDAVERAVTMSRPERLM